MDGYINIGFVGGAIYFSMMIAESRRKAEILSAFGNLMTLYWIFELGWNIAGSVLFWGNDYSYYCGNTPYYAYMFARLIIYYIFIFIFIPFSRVRSQDAESDNLEIEVSARRDTELVPK